MDKNKNALAELAEELDAIACIPVIIKAQRIIAELAKEHPDTYACNCFLMLIDKCRAIAEEGGEMNKNERAEKTA